MIKDLRNANALLTGGSQGLGALMARALAQAGVNLVLTARSADKLQAVADEAKRFGVKAVTIPCDVTLATDRERLVREAEAALGPLDILINNAGAELVGNFLSKTPAELEQMITTNLTAPILLTRAIIPNMVARRRGHVVNLASLAGKMGLPFNATYGGTKAALLAWSSALRLELEGSGVSVSVVTPGYVSKMGMFSRHNSKAPALLGESKPEDVARGVLRALTTGAPEVIVNPRPFWPMHAAYVLAPELMVKSMHSLGIIKFLKRTYDKH